MMGDAGFKIPLGYFEMHQGFTIWHPNDKLKISADDQYLYMKRNYEDFEAVKVHKAPMVTIC